MSQDYQYGDYNRGGMLAFSFSMVITLAFFVYVAFIHSGVDLKEMEGSDSTQQEEMVPDLEVEVDE
jgi:hypothetical protein